ncbi:MAG: hypothetical protein GTO24_21235 [candidate division Zixibacteria bacterium]|nr:hypothetical protein [candidate division Zixibacteria bacterium]
MDKKLEKAKMLQEKYHSIIVGIMIGGIFVASAISLWPGIVLDGGDGYYHSFPEVSLMFILAVIAFILTALVILLTIALWISEMAKVEVLTEEEDKDDRGS